MSVQVELSRIYIREMSDIQIIELTEHSSMTFRASSCCSAPTMPRLPGAHTCNASSPWCAAIACSASALRPGRKSPAACVASLPPDEQWRCVLANYSYAFSATPMFPLQSSVDLYQLFAIARLGGWDAGCLNRGIQFKNCSASQLVNIKAVSYTHLTLPTKA